jgi:DNA-binding NtrC family response regulator
MNRKRILIADDTAASLSLLASVLEPCGYEVLAASNGKDALKLAERAHPDLIMLDIVMPGHTGFSVCRSLKATEATREIPVIFITSRQETESVVEGFRVGAVDYIVKPFRAEEVVTRVATHLKISGLTRELQQRNAELEEEIKKRQAAEHARERADQRISMMTSQEAHRWGLGGFVGKSPHLRRILDDIERLQNFGKTSVMITGESGTGKELVARAIHHSSPRTNGPFVPVNCVAVPEDLAESLFFGHLKGSFTGATADRKGHFELADGGTLFLDEIGDMPAGLQAKLLRVLEDGVIHPVGAAHSRQVDVRVLAATNADLQAKIAAGEFRQDLFFRLARYTVETPPLRERREDLPLLVAHFLEVFAAEMGIGAPAVDSGALHLLQFHPFPGNVRELKNVIERALILSGGKTITPAFLQLLPAGSAVTANARQPISTAIQNLPLNLEDAEQALIERALDQTRGNVAEAARLLNVNRSRIYRRFPHLGKESPS